MYYRHPYNPNLILQNKESHWNNLPVQQKCGPLVTNYLNAIFETLNAASSEYPRTCAIRFDLHLPMGYADQDTKVITRFFASLNAQIKADVKRKMREHKRSHPCRIRYVWVKEQGSSHHCHYHVCIFLNRDAYFTLGKFKTGCVVLGDDMPPVSDNEARVSMASRINSAWASALGFLPWQSVGLMHFPGNSVYRIDRNSPDAAQQYADLFYRVSYFAKASTKNYGDGSNHFGCSRA